MMEMDEQKQNGLENEPLENEALDEEQPVNGQETSGAADGSAEQQTENAADAEAPAQPTPEELINAINEKYLRLRADFDNYTKRMAREANDIRERAKRSVITEFLPVYDFFQMALHHAETSDDVKSLKQGMDMILNEFTKAFDTLGVKELKTVGEAFDPKLHEAVKTEPSETVPEGVVIQQWKAGYMMGDKLLRAAMVVVSAGSPAAKPEQEPEQN